MLLANPYTDTIDTTSETIDSEHKSILVILTMFSVCRAHEHLRWNMPNVSWIFSIYFPPSFNFWFSFIISLSHRNYFISTRHKEMIVQFLLDFWWIYYKINCKLVAFDQCDQFNAILLLKKIILCTFIRDKSHCVDVWI